MIQFTITTQITCGKTTCAVIPGEFCPHFGNKSFGTRPWCMLFDRELFDKDGWVQRCKQCLDAEKEAK